MKKILTGLILCVFVLFFNAYAGNKNVNSEFKVKLYGFVKFETILDNTELAKGDWMLFARSGQNSSSGQNIFTMNARHTRLGIKISGPEAKGKRRINGLVEFDFAGGFTNSSTAARQPVLRLRHAWVEINTPKYEARFGQDWALISGPFPNTTSFVVGAGKGNLWMRYAQMRLTFKNNKSKIAFSLNRPMAGNIKYNDFESGDFDPVGDGERTGLPWLMGRLWLYSGKTSFSVSGHYGTEKITDLSGSPHNMVTYSVNADFISSFGPFFVTGRGFLGENLNSFFGGVFQGFTRDSLSVNNVKSKGGWGQIKFKINDLWGITAGGGVDDPVNSDIDSGMRSKNQWLFANITHTVQKSLIFMLECDYLKTSYIDREEGENIRFQFVTYFKF